MKKILMCVLGAAALCACHNSEEKLNVIALETPELVVGAEGGEQVIKTKYNHWYITEWMTICGEDTARFKNTTYTYTPLPGQMEDITYFHDTIGGEWYTAIKDETSLLLKIEANRSGKEKKLILELRAGNIPGETFTLIQEEK